jgi:hypothetical protein
VTASIPAKIPHPMRLKHVDVIEWIWTTEGFDPYVKVKKVAKASVITLH